MSPNTVHRPDPINMPTKSDTQVVEEMLDILNSPEVWCKGVLERYLDANVQRCLMGALNFAALGKASSWVLTLPREQRAQYIRIVQTMDIIAKELGYDGAGGRGKTPLYADSSRIPDGAPTVEFNNAIETSYEDVRLFLKEALVRVDEGA